MEGCRKTLGSKVLTLINRLPFLPLLLRSLARKLLCLRYDAAGPQSARSRGSYFRIGFGSLTRACFNVVASVPLASCSVAACRGKWLQLVCQRVGNALISKKVPCVRCAKRIWSRSGGSEGLVDGPLVCVLRGPGKPCERCQRLKKVCRPLPPPCRPEAARLAGLEAGMGAVKEAEVFEKRLEEAFRRRDKVDVSVQALRNVNRSLFLMLNELREANHKPPVSVEECEDWEGFW